jgi:hypothetical protein
MKIKEGFDELKHMPKVSCADVTFIFSYNDYSRADG